MPPRLVPSPTLLHTLRSLTSQPFHPPTRPHLACPRYLTSTSHHSIPPPPSSPTPATQSRDRGPESTEETQTDFTTADIYSNTAPPTNSISACLPDGFHLDNGVKIGGGDGLLLVAGEAFAWRPWNGGVPGKVLPSVRSRGGTSAGTGGSVGTGGGGGKMEHTAGARKGASLVNAKGQWEIPELEGLGKRAWGLLERVWPRPEMLILGLGPRIRPLSPLTRKRLHALGIRIEVLDTRNAAAQFNLLATERGVSNIAAALVPIGRVD